MVKQEGKCGFSIPLFVFLGLMVLLTVSCTDKLPTNADLLVTVAGKVTDSETGLPIEGASLKLYYNERQGENQLDTDKTDSDGDYTLKGKHNCQRVLQVHAQAEGYQDWNVSVYCQEQPQTVNFQLKPWPQ